jgi:hypothetical protein
MINISIFFFTFGLIYGELTSNILYPFGTSNGDSKAPKTTHSTNFGPFKFKQRSNLEFFDERYSSLYINSCGLVLFNNYDFIYDDGTPFKYPNNEFSALAPFWSHIDTVRCGDIYYRETIDTDILRRISEDIKKSFNHSSSITWAFIVTFHGVCTWDSFLQSLTNTFQIVITTDVNSSYAIYNYGQLSWFDPDNSKYYSKSSALYNAGDGVRYSMLPGSLTSNITKLSLLSNVGMPGKWIFHVGTVKK